MSWERKKIKPSCSSKGRNGVPSTGRETSKLGGMINSLKKKRSHTVILARRSYRPMGYSRRLISGIKTKTSKSQSFFFLVEYLRKLCKIKMRWPWNHKLWSELGVLKLVKKKKENRNSESLHIHIVRLY